MAVNIQGDLDGGVPHLPLDLVDVTSLLDLEGSIGMAEIVPANIPFNSRSDASFLELPLGEVVDV